MSFKRNTLSVCFVLSLVACSLTPLVSKISKNNRPREAIRAFDSEVVSALDSKADLLSPLNFEKAAEGLRDCKLLLKMKESSDKILRCVDQGRAVLAQANQYTKAARVQFDSVIVTRQLAIIAEAPFLFPAEFQYSDDVLRTMARQIEKGQHAGMSRGRRFLQAKYAGLELQGIKLINLGESRAIIDEAMREGAKRLAPMRLALAEKTYQVADNYITHNRHDNYKILQLSKATMENAVIVLEATREAQKNQNSVPEEIAKKMN